MAAVQVTLTDGSNTAIQNYINVPVNGFGVFTVQITGAGAVNMLAGTRITLKVNGVTVAGEPLTSWYIFNNIHNYNNKPVIPEKLHNHIGFVSPYLVLYDEFSALENLKYF